MALSLLYAGIMGTHNTLQPFFMASTRMCRNFTSHNPTHKNPLQTHNSCRLSDGQFSMAPRCLALSTHKCLHSRGMTIRFHAVVSDSRDEFLQDPLHRSLSWSHNKSEMERVGRTRMAACKDGLLNRFGTEIEIKPTFVRYYGQKYTAIDFAAARVTIGGVDIDVDAEVANNPEFKVNHAVKTRHSGRTYQGCKRRGGPVRGGRQRGGANGGGRGRGGPHTRSLGSPPPPLPPHQPRQTHPPAPHLNVTNPVATSSQVQPGSNPPLPVNSVVTARNEADIDDANQRQSQQSTVAPTSTSQSRPGQAAPPLVAENFRGPTNSLYARDRQPTAYLPPLNGVSTGGATYFANFGDYSSNKISNRIGGIPDRYGPYVVRPLE